MKKTKLDRIVIAFMLVILFLVLTTAVSSASTNATQLLWRKFCPAGGHILVEAGSGGEWANCIIPLPTVVFTPVPTPTQVLSFVNVAENYPIFLGMISTGLISGD